ncbi:autotransporter-associated beta strand repeat-containing protein [Glycomyces buryatensis]|uniref:Autotransporter n=1 Tax=Glycomyces buryatensis TaxID=2570927 RepID=A0A4S8PR21_9ACTN|nr:autotransporter-associated beta strand repeat-containing protein [Glycomyces buryatensis]THV33617.1 hypothetical protein FAB82_26140 [Glycomyces buryatensis]
MNAVQTTAPPPRRPWTRILLVALLAFLPVPFAAAPAQAAQDITDRIRSGEDVVLDGDADIKLDDGEEVTYGGVISGVGTLTISGGGKLILTANSDFSIPEDRQTQTVEARGEPWWWNTIENPDPPAVTVEAGATLQYGDGQGETGVIGHYPYDLSNFEWNALNHHVDGTLIVAVHGGRYHPGNLSGSGYIAQQRHTWDGLSLAGKHTFSGVLYNGTVIHYSQREFLSTLPDVDTITNQGSFIIDTQEGNDTVVGANFFSREWGNDINFHSQIFGSKVVMTGVYSWSDSGEDWDPSLSDPNLNYQVVDHNNNKRGINIEGAKVQWGDGTDADFFLPGNRDTVYINMHARRIRSHLILNYNGPVTLGMPISGGIYHDTMTTPGEGDVTIAGTDGNEVTFADQQNYNGATTIESGAVLRLGTGEAGGDAWLLMDTELSEVVDEGALVVDNAEKDIELSDISGGGSLEQAGQATLTLTGDTSYTGATTVSDGTLALTGASLAESANLELTGEKAVFDVSAAEESTVPDLSGIEGSSIALGSSTLTVENGEETEYAGGVTGEGALVKSGEATLTYTGSSAAEGAWTVSDGTLALGGAELAGDLGVEKHLAVTEKSTVGGDLTMGDESTLTVGTGTGLAVAGDAVLDGTLKIDYAEGDPLPEEIPVVTAEGKIEGTFAGLEQDAAVDIGGTEYTVAYEEGQVVLRTDAPQAAAPEEEGASFSDLSGNGWPVWAYVLAGLFLLLLIGSGVLVFYLLRKGDNIDDEEAESTESQDATMELPMVKTD